MQIFNRCFHHRCELIDDVLDQFYLLEFLLNLGYLVNMNRGFVLLTAKILEFINFSTLSMIYSTFLWNSSSFVSFIDLFEYE
jgi:hypothetical protein